LQDLEEVEDGKEGRFATSWKIMIPYSSFLKEVRELMERCFAWIDCDSQ
jgi:hypothetical protein